MRRLVVVVVMVCLALPQAVPARADFGLIIGVLSFLFDLKKNDDNYKATAPMERSDTQLPVLANLWWMEHWAGYALNLETCALQVRQGAVVEYSLNLVGKPHLLGCPMLRLKSNQDELGQQGGGDGAYVVRGGKIVIDTRLLPTKAYDLVIGANFTNGEDQAGRKGRGRVPHPDSTEIRLVLVVLNEEDIVQAANDPGVQKVLSWSSGLTGGVPVLSGPKFPLSPEIVQETGLLESMPPSAPSQPSLRASSEPSAPRKSLRERCDGRSGQQGAAQQEQPQPPQPQPQPYQPRLQPQPEIQVMDQPGQEPEVDVSQLPWASELERTARCVGFKYHPLQFVPSFTPERNEENRSAQGVAQPLVIFFVDRSLQLLRQDKMFLWKQSGGHGQFVRLALARRSGWEQSFLFVSDAKPGDIFAPEFGGKIYPGVRISAGCGCWYPAAVE